MTASACRARAQYVPSRSRLRSVSHALSPSIPRRLARSKNRAALPRQGSKYRSKRGGTNRRSSGSNCRLPPAHFRNGRARSGSLTDWATAGAAAVGKAETRSYHAARSWFGRDEQDRRLSVRPPPSRQIIPQRQHEHDPEPEDAAQDDGPRQPRAVFHVHEEQHHERRFEHGDDRRRHGVQTPEIQKGNLHGEVSAGHQDAEDDVVDALRK